MRTSESMPGPHRPADDKTDQRSAAAVQRAVGMEMSSQLSGAGSGSPFPLFGSEPGTDEGSRSRP